jgi:predicted FMN-binding regulatory protein PaiB
MYRRLKSSENCRESLLTMMREIGIATLVTPTPAGIEATQVPIVVREAADGTLILDRLTHRCHILETCNDSFRFRANSGAVRKTKETTGIDPHLNPRP